jgi:hypothetical protein
MTSDIAKLTMTALISSQASPASVARKMEDQLEADRQIDK